MIAPHNNEAAVEYSKANNSDLDVVNLITRLLVSKEGAVLRRLVMTVVSVTNNLFFVNCTRDFFSTKILKGED